MRKLTILAMIAAFVACKPQSNPKESISTVPDFAAFDTSIAGKKVGLFLLENSNGIKVYITNYGARIVALMAPDKSGKNADITLGYGDIKAYLNDNMYTGPVVGRFANRIANAKFTLDGVEYILSMNDGDNTLHGGFKGIDKKVWDAVQDSNSITLTYLSPDGDEGYPGNLFLKQVITLTPGNELKFAFEATTDKATVVNLTNHTYFNLKGEGDSTILDHYVQILADQYTPVDNEWIPTGEIASVENTPFDFRSGKPVGRDIEQDNEQLKNGKGYDHNWVVNTDTAGAMTLVAKVWETSTGRSIEYYSTEPGVQFYCGNFMNGTVTGKSGRAYLFRAGLLFEPQRFPDSPNHANFPSSVLRPGEKYMHTMALKFGVMP